MDFSALKKNSTGVRLMRCNLLTFSALAAIGAMGFLAAEARADSLEGAFIEEAFEGEIIEEAFEGEIIEEAFEGEIIEEAFEGEIIEEAFEGEIIEEAFEGEIIVETIEGDFDEVEIVSSVRASSPEEEVEQQLLEYAVIAGVSDGYEVINEPFFDVLDEGETSATEIVLRGGREHAIVVVCDNDCDDVDVRLYDSDGDLVDEDVDSSDQAVLNGRPSVTEAYTVLFEMVDCDFEPCVIGALLFRK